MGQANRRAVIDLGTNTFHLLVADVEKTVINEVYRERRYVKLASEGIETIGQQALQRGMDALIHYAEVLREHGCDDVLAFGTAALRTASNGPEFVSLARRRTGIDVTIIPGDEEARLITKGVLAALPPLDDRILIMDIGGGSTEFVIADRTGVHYSQSFPIGIGVLTNEFHKSDPIAPDEVRRIHAYLAATTAPLTEALIRYPTTHLVGAAGTFEVLTDLLPAGAPGATSVSHELEVARFTPLRDRLYASTQDERLLMDGLPPERADMIVAAFVLVDYVLNLLPVERVTVSGYAMKEGILLSKL